MYLFLDGTLFLRRKELSLCSRVNVLTLWEERGTCRVKERGITGITRGCSAQAPAWVQGPWPGRGGAVSTRSLGLLRASGCRVRAGSSPWAKGRQRDTLLKLWVTVLERAWQRAFVIHGKQRWCLSIWVAQESHANLPEAGRSHRTWEDISNPLYPWRQRMLASESGPLEEEKKKTVEFLYISNQYLKCII